MSLSILDTAGLCDITTTGRVTGRAHTIEIWFCHHEGIIYLLSGGGDRSDWVRNIRATPEVIVEIGDLDLKGRARTVSNGDEAALARRLVYEKYRPRYAGSLTGWGDTSLPIAIDLDV